VSNSITAATGEAAAAVVASSGGFASHVHVGLCMVALLIIIPSGALVARYAKVTGSAAAFDLHYHLQFGVGAFASRLLPLCPFQISLMMLTRGLYVRFQFPRYPSPYCRVVTQAAFPFP
jgi:hypothetical protein